MSHWLLHKIVIGVVAYALLAISFASGRIAERNEAADFTRTFRQPDWPAVASLVACAVLVVLA